MLEHIHGGNKLPESEILKTYVEKCNEKRLKCQLCSAEFADHKILKTHQIWCALVLVSL